jgi:hypothetical protein
MFIKLNGGTGFMISIEPAIVPSGEHLVQTLHEWGAWRDYFRRLGLRMKGNAMDRRGYYMVPTQWPHGFSADETPEIDYAAGNAFAAEYQAKRAKERDYGTRAMRLATIAAAKSKFPMRDKFPVTPESHLKQKRAPGIDVDQLMKDHAHDLANAPKGTGRGA